MSREQAQTAVVHTKKEFIAALRMAGNKARPCPTVTECVRVDGATFRVELFPSFEPNKLAKLIAKVKQISAKDFIGAR